YLATTNNHRTRLSEDQKIQKIREFHENPLGVHHGLTRTFNKMYEEYNWKGPLPRSHSGNSFILTLQDDLTKFAWASPMENHESNTVAQHFVTKFVCLHRIPQSLVTDCAEQMSTTPYHPQSNGSLDRSHRSLAEYLRNFVERDQLNWPYHLVYGNPVKVLTSFINNPEPQCNYNVYQYEVKRQMQEAQAFARINLLEAKRQKVLLQEKAVKTNWPQSGLVGKLSMVFFGVFQKNPSFPKIAILIIWIWDSTKVAQENFKITTFPDHKGLYYNSHGMVKTSHIKWDLVTWTLWTLEF
ncbi:igE-binding protein-like, partial [Aphis craccivora]